MEALDDLTPEELARIKGHIEDKRSAQTSSWETNLDAAVADLREGISEEDLQEIVAAMNAKAKVPPAG